MGAQEDVDLPKTNVKRIITSKLTELAGEKNGKKYAVSKDALMALGEGAKVFIHYVTTLASETCREAKRQTISAKDVLDVLKECGLEELVPQLQVFLQRFQEESKAKYQAKKLGGAGAEEGGRKRKEGEEEDDEEDTEDGAGARGGKRARYSEEPAGGEVD